MPAPSVFSRHRADGAGRMVEKDIAGHGADGLLIKINELRDDL